MGCHSTKIASELVVPTPIAGLKDNTPLSSEFATSFGTAVSSPANIITSPVLRVHKTLRSFELTAENALQSCVQQLTAQDGRSEFLVARSKLSVEQNTLKELKQRFRGGGTDLLQSMKKVAVKTETQFKFEPFTGSVRSVRHSKENADLVSEIPKEPDTNMLLSPKRSIFIRKRQTQAESRNLGSLAGSPQARPSGHLHQKSAGRSLSPSRPESPQATKRIARQNFLLKCRDSSKAASVLVGLDGPVLSCGVRTGAITVRAASKHGSQSPVHVLGKSDRSQRSPQEARPLITRCRPSLFQRSYSTAGRNLKRAATSMEPFRMPQQSSAPTPRGQQEVADAILYECSDSESQASQSRRAAPLVSPSPQGSVAISLRKVATLEPSSHSGSVRSKLTLQEC